MKIKNIKESKSFPFLSVYPKDLSEDLMNDIKRLSSVSDPSKEELDLFLSKTDNDLKEAMESLGVQYPWQKIELTVTTGSVLFYAFLSQLKKEKAPLAQAIQQKKVMDYAQALNPEEFKEELEVTDDVMKATKDVFNDEEKWNTFNVFASVDIGNNEKRYTSINSNGLNFYTSVMNSVLGMFL